MKNTRIRGESDAPGGIQGTQSMRMVIHCSCSHKHACRCRVSSDQLGFSPLSRFAAISSRKSPTNGISSSDALSGCSTLWFSLYAHWNSHSHAALILGCCLLVFRLMVTRQISEVCQIMTRFRGKSRRFWSEVGYRFSGHQLLLFWIVRICMLIWLRSSCARGSCENPLLSTWWPTYRSGSFLLSWRYVEWMRWKTALGVRNPPCEATHQQRRTKW